MPGKLSKDECAMAFSNPACPYITQINLNTNCMANVDKALNALLGEDGTALNGGVIFTILKKLDSLEGSRKVTISWLGLLKPVAVSVIITALSTYIVAHFV